MMIVCDQKGVVIAHLLLDVRVLYGMAPCFEHFLLIAVGCFLEWTVRTTLRNLIDYPRHSCIGSVRTGELRIKKLFTQKTRDTSDW
jgi:hypothetical protein